MLKDLQTYADAITRQSNIMRYMTDEEKEALKTPKFSAKCFVYRDEIFNDEESAMEHLLDSIKFARSGLKKATTKASREKGRHIIAEAGYGLGLLMKN